ncbi:hypothetical protein PanWU01x14_143440 [Parasponia andersonii]|uniref:Uncharacterized protein n=1 Tax=Parasponia andersonii TaxID=3476 RepID=A0A2P5CL35_PARAD|nr:hypothetical protein PanWU01x14_143440 [Parasponia andersonii]
MGKEEDYRLEHDDTTDEGDPKSGAPSRGEAEKMSQLQVSGENITPIAKNVTAVRNLDNHPISQL